MASTPKPPSALLQRYSGAYTAEERALWRHLRDHCDYVRAGVLMPLFGYLGSAHKIGGLLLRLYNDGHLSRKPVAGGYYAYAVTTKCRPPPGESLQAGAPAPLADRLAQPATPTRLGQAAAAAAASIDFAAPAPSTPLASAEAAADAATAMLAAVPASASPMLALQAAVTLAVTLAGLHPDRTMAARVLRIAATDIDNGHFCALPVRH